MRLEVSTRTAAADFGPVTIFAQDRKNRAWPYAAEPHVGRPARKSNGKIGVDLFFSDATMGWIPFNGQSPRQWIIIPRGFKAPERVTGWEIIQWKRAAFNGSEVARSLF